MSKWSGRGNPPTRKKLHRLRRAIILQKKADAKAERTEQQRWEYKWGKLTRGAVINPERFDELWG